ncbi:unnamed protein product [Rotaria sp. Silwood1]|nr:unnamed protein product [Rotaria sp. Silwood1]CAF3715170.1 unnamed protein product [Rotaria sp. Silwood1]CAF4556293.1 unnamed protein product [Rotaria sp. Silwood1]
MYIRQYNPRLYLCLLYKHIKNFSTISSSNIIKSYPNYVERQTEVVINTSSGDEFIEIDRETKVKIPKPTTSIRANINYIDTNPLGDKKQSIVLLVHGYPGTHESIKNFIEEFQQRNFRCIAPDMPYCGKTTMPLWSGIIWKNSVYLRARFLGELLKNIMQDKLVPIHTVIGFHENAYTLMSMIDQYEYFHCQSLILVNPVPRKLIRFFPLAKFAFDFGRIPLHWPIAKFLLNIFGYKELLNYSQRDIMAALRIWMVEDTYQYDAYVHNLWLSRLRTMVILSEEDKHLDRKLLDALIKDLAVESFNKSSMANAVIKKYSCDHNELLTDRISYIVNDIETFLSMAFMSPAATIPQSFSSTITKEKERRKQIIETNNNNNNEQKKSNIELDESAYKRASVNDFFSNAFGPSQSELKPNQSHSLRSAFENIAGGFIERLPPGTKRETLASVKEEMRKKKIRIDTKN